jgi:hypothetical protein
MEVLRAESGAANQLAALVYLCMEANQPMYLFIDEYDHFTNAILSDAATERNYKAETHGTGSFRAFFDAIKAGTDSAIKRCFITGVSPVTMDDLTSGFNIGTNYTTQAQFNIFPDIEHSYVLELKYLPARATQTEVDAAAAQAREQLLRYAQSVAIERTYKPTQLHRLVLVWHGMELAVAEEL